MAAAGPAAGHSSPTEERLNVYSDLNQNDKVSLMFVYFNFLQVNGTTYDALDTVFFTPQDLDRIAEANELFDAVLTGSVDRDKKVTTNILRPKKTPAKEEAKSTAVTTEKGRHFSRRLTMYIGNFPWVSNTHS